MPKKTDHYNILPSDDESSTPISPSSKSALKKLKPKFQFLNKFKKISY